MLGLGVWLGDALDDPPELDVSPEVDVLPELGEVAAPDVLVVPVGPEVGVGLAGEVLWELADVDGRSRAVADDSGVPTFAGIASGEGVADPVTGVDAVVVVGVAGAVVGAGSVAADDVGAEGLEAFAVVGAAGSSCGATVVGEVPVATGVVATDVRRVGALVVPLSEAASGPSSTKPPAVTATASAPPAARPRPTRAGRMRGSRPTRAGPG